MKYSISSKTSAFTGFIVAEYLQQNIAKIDVSEANLTPDQWLWLPRFIPHTEENLQKSNDKFFINTIPADLSFQNFWDAYKYKVGDKKRAEKLWSALEDFERIAVLQNIPRYNYFLQTSKTNKVYPETFLAQRRWENEYPFEKTVYGK